MRILLNNFVSGEGASLVQWIEKWHDTHSSEREREKELFFLLIASISWVVQRREREREKVSLGIDARAQSAVPRAFDTTRRWRGEEDVQISRERASLAGEKLQPREKTARRRLAQGKRKGILTSELRLTWSRGGEKIVFDLCLGNPNQYSFLFATSSSSMLTDVSES